MTTVNKSWLDFFKCASFEELKKEIKDFDQVLGGHLGPHVRKDVLAKKKACEDEIKKRREFKNIVNK